MEYKENKRKQTNVSKKGEQMFPLFYSVDDEVEDGVDGVGEDGESDGDEVVEEPDELAEDEPEERL